MEIKVVKQILEWNENCHKELQNHLKKKKVFMMNVMGSPGAGKTTFILNLLKELKQENIKAGVIEGDIAGQIDAEKMAEIGIPVVQLNTDGACHIEAMSIKNILQQFNLDELDLIIIENIGNLVCPAEFDEDRVKEDGYSRNSDLKIFHVNSRQEGSLFNFKKWLINKMKGLE